MRQVILESPRELHVVDAIDVTPAVGELLVEVKTTAICGTDVHIYDGGTLVDYPRVLGHEVSGVVQDFSDGVTQFNLGDSVAVNPNLICGNCERCILGKENLCESGRLLGREIDGTLREFLVVPQINAFRLPPAVTFISGALIQPLSTVVHAQRLADIRSHESVAVLGQGATGLMHTQLAKLSGASPVIAVGRTPAKLELAESMGADHVVNAADVDPVYETLRLTDGQGADVVIEAIGKPETLRQAIDAVKPGGRVIAFGISPDPLLALDLYRMYLAERTLIFPRAMIRADFHRAVSLVASGKIDLGPMVSADYALEDAAAAFRFAEEDPSKVLRVALHL
ncbi:MAG: alcohol dehydrogenase catalytic domain-containing protein [SAR202 cluster bacterium]|nr:alcohol dehydrogenase catalytic domain-containing protein [SAR202 cluster bacterium]